MEMTAERLIALTAAESLAVEDLGDLKRDDLVAVAAERKVEHASKATVPELLDLLVAPKPSSGDDNKQDGNGDDSDGADASSSESSDDDHEVYMQAPENTGAELTVHGHKLVLDEDDCVEVSNAPLEAVQALRDLGFVPFED